VLYYNGKTVARRRLKNVMSKLIIVNDNDKVKLTFEQTYLKYQNLLRKKAYSWAKTYGYDEMYQVASIALWKAYEKYDSEKFPVRFVYIAAKFIDNELLAFHNKNKQKFDKKTSQIKSMVSLNDIVFDSKGEGIELLELIGEEETYTEEIVDKILLSKMLKKFTKQQQQDIMDYINGYKLKELADSKNISNQVLALRMQAVFAKFRALYIKETAI